MKKLLGCAKRGAVQFLGAVQQAEMYAELLMQGLRIVADHVKTAAFRWTLGPEGAHDHIASGLDRAVGQLALQYWD